MFDRARDRWLVDRSGGKVSFVVVGAADKTWDDVMVRRVICASSVYWFGLRAGVGRDAVGGFGDAYGVDLGVGGEGVIESTRELVGDVFGEVFCGWIEAIERGGFVEVVVGEGLADFDELGLDGVEVAEEAVVVKTVFEGVF